MRTTKQDEISRLQYNLIQADNTIKKLEKNNHFLKNSHEERKLVVAERVSSSLALVAESMSKLILSINGQL